MKEFMYYRTVNRLLLAPNAQISGGFGTEFLNFPFMKEFMYYRTVNRLLLKNLMIRWVDVLCNKLTV